MKKVLLGLISIILAGQVSFAQPVSDMAVIPMGITVQSVMRLTITKGGNIEFVFKSAGDIGTGLPVTGAFESAYQTTGTVAASQLWAINLTVDAANFLDDAGAADVNLNLSDVEFQATDPVAGVITDDLSSGWAAGSPAAFPIMVNQAIATAAVFDIMWRCGVGVANTISGTSAGRYTLNVILTLEPTP